jgi:hypothetical protein
MAAGFSGANMDDKSVRVQLSADGAQADFGQIKSIGIRSILDLKSYHKSQVDDRVMHIIEFNDGGTCEVTYLTNGKLDLFHGTKIRTHLNPQEGAIVVGQFPPSELSGG